MVERRDVSDVVAIAALCEIAEESAVGGDLDELLVAARRAASDREPGRDRRGRGRRSCAAADDRHATTARLAGAARRDRRRDATARAGPRSRGAVAVHGGAEGCPGHDRRAPAGGRAGLSRPALARDARVSKVAARLRYAGGMEGGGFFPFGGDPGGDPARAARVRGDPVGERQGRAARAVRDADAEHRRRAHRRRAEAGAADRRPDEQAAALRDAMRVLFPEAVALVSAARQGFMRESLTARPRYTRVPVGLFDRAVASVLPAVPRSVVRRVSAPVHRRRDARRCATHRRLPERRGEAGDDRRARRGDPHAPTRRRRSPRRTATCSLRSQPTASTRTSRSSSPGSG